MKVTLNPNNRGISWKGGCIKGVNVRRGDDKNKKVKKELTEKIGYLLDV